ncbi:MAG: hypothetical protein Q9166_001640 [cf. Caloplaca sp. 2 TL-2023]
MPHSLVVNTYLHETTNPNKQLTPAHEPDQKYHLPSTVLAMIGNMAATSLSSMPTEIVNGVLANLDKKDLKVVRRLNRHFDEIVRTLLFDKVVITSAIDNTVLFTSIMGKPEMAKHVKTLAFDIACYQDISAAYYVEYLMQQMEHDVGRHRAGFALMQPTLLKSLEDANWFKGK